VGGWIVRTGGVLMSAVGVTNGSADVSSAASTTTLGSCCSSSAATSWIPCCAGDLLALFPGGELGGVKYAVSFPFSDSATLRRLLAVRIESLRGICEGVGCT
jgi:hypothetical protein